jgi:GntR family transcriptional regulator, transcriptional repressor for pyruvate dehydrogenase complex
MVLAVTGTATALPLRRGYLADGVFAALGAEILGGTLAPGEALPAERVLSERFGVSKLLVRQAIHRLAEAGLVDVRQGGTTRVRDPGDASDLRIFELYYRLAPDSERTRELSREVLEKQFTQGLSLVEVFARRATTSARDALVKLTAEARAHASDEMHVRRFEERFWRMVGDACENRILRAEVRWWYGALTARPEMPNAKPPTIRLAFYSELARRLRDDDSPVPYYLGALTPAVAALFDEPAPKKKQKKKASR